MQTSRGLTNLEPKIFCLCFRELIYGPLAHFIIHPTNIMDKWSRNIFFRILEKLSFYWWALNAWKVKLFEAHMGTFHTSCTGLSPNIIKLWDSSE